MDDLSNNIWAKLVALRPENRNISFPIKPDHSNQYQVDGEWRIYQDAARDIKIVCLSASCIKVDDIWLGMNQEKKLQGGEMIAFSEDKSVVDNSFDYVFCLTNHATPVEGLKRKRDENDDSKDSLLSQKIKKFTNEMNQEFSCAICIETISDCAMLIPCFHYFCSQCITKMLKSSTECPLCRQKIQSWNKNIFIQRFIDSATSVLDLEELKQKTETSKESNTSEENGVYTGAYSSDGKREGQGKMTYNDGRVYEGAWKNDKREGKGKLTYKDGTFYDGPWKNDKREGKGVLSFKDSVFKGEWIDDILQPFVQVQYTNGDYYFGEVKDFKRHGNGVMISNCSIYDGAWSNDQREGWGKLKCRGRTYEGNWMCDTMHGLGKIKFPNGNIFEGNWCDGKISGFAILTRPNGDILEGQWTCHSKGKGEISFAHGGRFDGSWKLSSQKLTMTLKSGNQYEEIGSIDSKIREFKIRYVNGNTYTGMVGMEHLCRRGKGKMFFKSGDEYYGDWEHNELHGTGKYIWKKSGLVYIGQFRKGNKDGRGTMTYADGTKWSGEWKNDKKVVQQELVPENSTNEN